MIWTLVLPRSANQLAVQADCPLNTVRQDRHMYAPLRIFLICLPGMRLGPLDLPEIPTTLDDYGWDVEKYRSIVADTVRPFLPFIKAEDLVPGVLPILQLSGFLITPCPTHGQKPTWHTRRVCVAKWKTDLPVLGPTWHASRKCAVKYKTDLLPPTWHTSRERFDTRCTTDHCFARVSVRAAMRFW